MKKTVVFTVSWIIMMGACTDDPGKVRKKETIPEEDLVQIIVDIHLTDNLMGNRSVLSLFHGRDSISNYKNIFDAYGYSIEAFENTIYYYSEKPDDFELIYDRVLNHLSEIEGDIKNENFAGGDTDSPGNLWNEKTEWHLPPDGPQNKIPFSIEIGEEGFYVIRVRIKMYQDDQSLNPTVSAWFWYDDGTEEGKKYPFPESEIPKSDSWKFHAMTLRVPDPRVTHIKGFLLDHDERQGYWNKHVDVDNISVRLLN